MIKQINQNSLYSFQELPINHLQIDNNQPRKDYGTKEDKGILKKSIQERGILNPIAVNQVENDRYTIIDGHRRYKAAKELELATVPCIIYAKLKDAEFEIRRFELQNNRRPWKPLERSNAFSRIKDLLHLRNNQQLADLIGVSKSLVNNSLQLREIKLEYVTLMERYGLTEAYQTEFVRFKSKIRRIGDFEVDDIIENLFQRVKNKVIKSAKEFRKLGRIFLRATANEAALLNFLSNPDMTTKELEKQSVRSNRSLYVELLTQQLSQDLQKGIEPNPQDIEGVRQLIKIANIYVKHKMEPN